MRVVVSGGTGVIGRSAVAALLASGHDVAVVSRSARNAAVISELGARPLTADLFDVSSLCDAFAGAEVVVNLATHVPIGYAAAWRRAWRTHDRLRTTGARNVAAAARAASVRRLVQESVSFVYADQRDSWVTENSPLEITRVTEPVAVAESAAQSYACESRVGVVLRFGQIVGDDPNTRHWLRAARHGRAVGLGDPEGWAHLVHTDDLGAAVVAALQATTGVYNVGAAPVRRRDLVDGYAAAVGRPEVGFLGPVARRAAGARVEPVSRSLRVCGDQFTAQTGWHPGRASFDATWLEAAAPEFSGSGR